MAQGHTARRWPNPDLEPERPFLLSASRGSCYDFRDSFHSPRPYLLLEAEAQHPSRSPSPPTACPAPLTSTRKESVKLVSVSSTDFSSGMPPRMSTGAWSTVCHRGLDETFMKYRGIRLKIWWGRGASGDGRRATQHSYPPMAPSHLG